MSKHLFTVGAAVGHKDLTGFKFDKDKPFTGCRICGAIFQSDLDRTTDDNSTEQLIINMQHRMAWSHKHAKTHTDAEHFSLVMSGRWCTPEAALRFAAYGVVPISDLVLDDEVSDAMRQASSVPANDVEGA